MKAIVQDKYSPSESVAVQPLNQPIEGAVREATVEVGNTDGAGMAELTRAGWETTDTPSIAPLRAVSQVVQA